MKLIRPARLELYSFLFTIPLVALGVNLLLFEERIWKDQRIWFYSMPLVMLLGSLLWYIHLLYDQWAESRYPSLQQSRKRILMKMLVAILVMSPGVLLILFLYDHFHLFGYRFSTNDLPKGLLLGLSVNLVFETLYESDYIFSRYKESREEMETLGQLATNQEFDLLKNQVNPHFLFNCFNTLSSLISVDRKQAEKFLDELSKVYRYLLRNNEEGLSTVENEIRFIHSYFRLLQTRHGEAVRLHVQIDKKYDSYVLPSLTLQLLVENVVKHNALSKNHPLLIDIFTAAGNKLVVSNNLRRRTVKAPSNGVGLDNIRSRYQLLGQKGFQVMADDKNFTVVLPLVWKGSLAENGS
jgi:sensor histidine kinase YesM